jgi:hypothetical protein
MVGSLFAGASLLGSALPARLGAPRRPTPPPALPIDPPALPPRPGHALARAKQD